jgi:hypothetical protein
MTIRKWYSKLDGLPGMTKESFQAISLKGKEMKENGKQFYGCLVMDEMSIKQHIRWTGTRHQGYIDFGLGVGLSHLARVLSGRYRNFRMECIKILNFERKIRVLYFRKIICIFIKVI